MISISDYAVKGSVLKEKIQEQGWKAITLTAEKRIVEISLDDIDNEKYYSVFYTLYDNVKAVQITEIELVHTAKEMDKWAF